MGDFHPERAGSPEGCGQRRVGERVGGCGRFWTCCCVDVGRDCEPLSLGVGGAVVKSVGSGPEDLALNSSVAMS